MSTGFPPFKAATPKGAVDELKKIAPSLDEVPAFDLPPVPPPPEAKAWGEKITITDDVPVEERPAEWQHLRICAKCHSTEVVEAVRIGDALYVKVS